MTDWLLPAALLVLLVLALNAASRAVTASTGRTPAIEGIWRLATPLGTGAAVLGVSALLNPPLPWLAFTAGLAAGILNLLVQLGAGRRAA